MATQKQHAAVGEFAPEASSIAAMCALNPTNRSMGYYYGSCTIADIEQATFAIVSITSAVSSADSVVDTINDLCKLRDTSARSFCSIHNVVL